MPIHKRKAALTLQTGQVVQYDGMPDDGLTQRGIPKGYLLLNTGQYAGTVNIDLVHLTAATLAFAATTPGTITDSANGLAIFKTNDVIVVTGTLLNDGVYTVSTGNVAGTIRTTQATVLEGAGAAVSLAKRESHSQNCIYDWNTGKLWAKTPTTKMGDASDGKLAYLDATKPHNLYSFVTAANAAALAGYSDWRPPTLLELWQLQVVKAGAVTLDPIWGGISVPYIHSSNTDPLDTTKSMMLQHTTASSSKQPKSLGNIATVLLIRP